MLHPVTLLIHRAERTDRLADGLGDLLTDPLPDPFAEEVVVVPARGVERWLTQRLSQRLGVGDRGTDGVCAGVRFLSPRSLVSMLLGRERDDPWDPDRLVWPLLEVIDAAMGEPWCRTLAVHLGFGLEGEDGVLRRSRRYAVARRLAGLFASYAVQRPQLVSDWRLGRDTDGSGRPLDEDLRWQAELWRRVVARVGTPPDQRHADTLDRLRRGAEDGLDMPARLSLFGHTRLPVTEAELLGALSGLRDVHLWLPQVSGRLWDALAPSAAAGPVPRREDPSAELVEHPLLGSLGRDARELQRTLAAAGPAKAGLVPEAVGEPDTLLGWPQHDLRANREPGEKGRAARRHQPGDRSVQVHACHGATRQVDVLREVLVGLLVDDPMLEPRDILVMCPDIEAYAPLIQAGFGLADVAPDGHPAHRLRVRLADRAPASTNPLLALAATLVRLAGGRATATEVLDLAGEPAVRRRFGFDDEDLAQLARWADQAGIRWGFDVEHRARYDLDLADNTWRFGLDRVLLGVAMAEHDSPGFGAALPVDDVASVDIDLAGRFGEYVDRLHAFVDEAGRASTVEQWTRALGTAVARLAAVAPDDVWQEAQLDRELAAMTDAAGDAGGDGSGTPLLLADLRNLLAHRLGGRPTRSNFRTGNLTVCTMVPMRSVPHRVVCLLGLDDGVFPRSSAVDGDDVLARDPRTGERDVRSEDRQLMLDAILATTQTLVVTYTGANEHTGAELPPAVPLGELLHTLDRTAAAPVRDAVLIRHPLQPFDVRNHTPGALGEPGPFSFDTASLAGALAARGQRTPTGPLLDGPLPARAAADVSLADLQAFLAHPVRAFLRRRLEVTGPEEADQLQDSIPTELDGLRKWQMGERLLGDLLRGLDPTDCLRAERLRGLLPPGVLGEQALTEVADQVRPLAEQAARLRQGTTRAVDVTVDLGDGRRLTGTVTPVFGNRVVRVSYSRLAAKHRLRAWVDLLALSAGHPDQNWTAHTVGRSRAGATLALCGPVDHRALTWLRELVDVYDRGMREPLPLPVKTACAYAEAAARLHRGDTVDPVREAAKVWQSDRFAGAVVPGEDSDPAHVRVFGEQAPVEVLLGTPRPDETWGSEPHRLGRLAWRVWRPLLEREQVGPL